MAAFVLYESALGYALFSITEAEDIGIEQDAVQASVTDLAKFGKICKLHGFSAFKSAKDALENINNVSEGNCTEVLKNFLETSLPAAKAMKKQDQKLGVAHPTIGQAISEATGIPCTHGNVVNELLRGVRLHFSKLIKSLSESANVERAQLGLGHSYSRAKVKFNVHRADNMIIQAISILDQIDKDINTFSMRVKEWYGYHFPELARIVNDNFLYARLVQLIKRRSTLTDESLPAIEEITMNSAQAQHVVDAAKSSMGMEVSDIDFLNIVAFAARVVSLTNYRKGLHEYLKNRMTAVAPNLSGLIGEQVGARLISHAGSLTNLAKCPASTVQILGAEKALFRALKTRGNTPKYGLIFHSSFIGRAAAKNKGRISRYVANKASMAARIDCFSESETRTDAYGRELKKQVEERLTFYETGEAPRKNLDVMREVAASAAAPAGAAIPAPEDAAADGKKKKSKKSKRSTDEMDTEPAAAAAESAEEPPSKKRKKEKKSRGDEE